MSIHNLPVSPDESAVLITSDAPQLRPARKSNRRCDPFSFIQASDFRLDSPCFPVTALPADMQDRLVQSRYSAAERVFDTAIEQQVDFVVLAGGLLDATLPGLQGPWFLADQFRRLSRQGIDIYWSGASLETRGRWPAHLDLPTNVHRLTAEAIGILHGRGGQPIARLVAQPDSASVPPTAEDVFTIGVRAQCGEIPDPLAGGVDFWALGGRPDFETLQVGEVVAHFAGSPQGRSPEEIGRHSCSLVQVDGAGAVRIQPHFTDIVRWHRQRLTIDDQTSWTDLQQQLDEQQQHLHTEAQVELHIVHYGVQGSGAAFEKLLHSRFRAELISRLNRLRPERGPAIWTMAVDPVIDAQQLARWRQQNTPLGTYLRELDAIAPTMAGMFGAPAGGDHPLGSMSEAAQLQILQQAARDGLYWLGPGQSGLRPAG